MKLVENYTKDSSLSSKVIRGGLWVFSLRSINNGLNFVRKIVLARLLSPEDFGLMGIAMLAITALETFSKTGIQAALIQKKEEIQSYLDTAWTVFSIRSLCICFVLLFSAPVISEFFNSPQATAIIRVIGLSVLLAGCKNIGIIYFQKNLEFNKQFVYELSVTFANMIVSISLAIILRSVWALVWGGITAAAVRLIMSFVIHPYRPKFRLSRDKFTELIKFGKWVSISSIIVFIINQGDDIFVGKILGVATLGIYQLAFFISNMPTTEISRVVAHITFPAYSKIQDDFKRIRDSYLKVLKITMVFSMPLAGGIFILAGDFSRIFLNEKWLPIIPAIQILIFAGLFRSIAATTGPLFHSLGFPKVDTFWQTIRLILLVLFIYPLTSLWGLQGTSLSVLISIFFSTIGFYVNALKIIRANFFSCLKSIILPAANSAIMVILIWYLKRIFVVIDIGELVLLVLAGSAIYLFILLLLDKFFNFKTITMIRDKISHN